ncbi:hypothetical protein NDN08_005011 [Rhodosorus marinus]|uniref:Protochlorophyllide reductase n=1 Tax=Rhodosorus marinus TaxID=101924 RepID=A0AAV8UKH2_9RHOD|nr:hypothetical protein NDN08_005011 [Rhodosorus marinus]
MSSTKWTADDMPDLVGKVAVVTGANLGLGREITKRLAEHNATVVMACRTASKGEATKKELLNEIGEDKSLVVMTLDVSSLESVKTFAKEFSSKYNKLDMLVENAGVMALDPRGTSADGYEMQFATNHLGHFLLTKLLLPTLEKTEGSRVVTQSSLASYQCKGFNWDDIQAEKSYDLWKQYYMTKLCNVCFAKELNTRLQNAGKSNPTAYVAHPGVIIGNLQQNSRQSLFEKVVYAVFGLFQGTYETGARPALYASSSPGATPGAFYGPSGPIYYVSDVGGAHPGEVKPPPISMDVEERRKLWELSEQLADVKFTI